MNSIFVLINFVENENMKKRLFYLVQAHEEVIVDMDIRVTGFSREDAVDFKPWLIIKNITRGVYLINKIREIFDPWVSFWGLSPVHPHQIPAEIKGYEKWNQKLEMMTLKIE